MPGESRKPAPSELESHPDQGAKREVPKPVDFGAPAPEPKRDRRQEKLRSAKETVKSVFEILKLSPDLMDSALASGIAELKKTTGLPEASARDMLRQSLIEVNENLRVNPDASAEESAKMQELRDRLVLAVTRLADAQPTPDGDEAQAA